MPNHILYLYFPIYDEELPDMAKLHAVARMAASLVAGRPPGALALRHGVQPLGSAGGADPRLHGDGGSPRRSSCSGSGRPGALFNEIFADYLGASPRAAPRPNP